MGLLDWFSFNKKRIDRDVREIVHASTRATLRSTRGRQTRARWDDQFSWYNLDVITRDEFRSKEIMDTLKIIRDVNPDASMAVWNLLRLGNSGHQLEVQKPNGTVDKKATELLNDYAKRMGKLYGGGVDQLINVLLLTIYTQGAIALEVEIAENSKDVEDFHAVDPSTLDFRRNKDTNQLELVQKQDDGTFIVLNPETVFYHGQDPDIDDPFGRAPILSILQIIFFQVQVLKDLQKVVHHQGHPRFDISVVEEAIIENMPQHIKSQGPEAIREFVQSYVSDVEEQMNNLEPDSDFFHTDSIKVEMTGGATQGQMVNVEKLIAVINQQIVTALKQLPILLGRNETATETHGSIQWQIYVRGIESLQRGVKRLLERAYNVVLQVHGIQGSAHLTFEELQTSDRKTDAEAESIETATKILQVNQGWIDNDEAAHEMVGHKAVNEPQMQQQQNEDSQDGQGTSQTLASLRTNRRQVKSEFNREEDGEDEYVGSIDEEWASDISKLASRCKSRIKRVLKDQLETYVKRLENANGMPGRVLSSAWSIRSIYKDSGIRRPSDDFEDWLRINILFDSDYQMTLLEDELLRYIDEGVEIAGSATLLELDVGITFNTDDENLLNAMTERSKRSAELIQGVTDEDVLQTLWEVVYNGRYSVEKAREALQESYSFAEYRAETIARTEILGAGRTGQYYADKQSGIVIGKKWRSALQERTRDGHKEADGQVVALDEPFRVANADGQIEQLLYPGDVSLNATASNTINCRCFYKRILEGQEMK